MSEVKVDKISPKTGTSMTVGDSGDTFTVPSGATLTVAGALNVTGTTALADGTVNVAELDIDGATDIGEAIVDADLFVVDNGAGGTNRKTAASRIKTYVTGDNSIDSDQYVDGSIDTAHIADDQVTLAKMAGLARGKIIYGDSSGNPAALALGSNGQILKSNGSDIAWAADAGFDVTSITGATALGATPADTDEFILSDAGTLKRVDYSYLKSLFGGVGFSARRDSSAVTLNHSTTTDLVFNTEIKDTNSAYNESTGVFTAPVTGFYVIGCNVNLADAQGNMDVQSLLLDIGGSSYKVAQIENTSNGTLFTKVSLSWCGIIGTISATTEIKMRAYIETTNSSAGEFLHTDYMSNFYGWSLR